MDIRSFFQTASTANAADSATVRLHHSGNSEQLQAGPVTFLGKVAAQLRSVFNITSDSERQATQAFISAIRKDYGSSGLEALKQLNVSEDKPLKLRQVKELSQRLQNNHASEELRPYRTLGQSHIVDAANEVWRWDRFTDLRRVMTHVVSDLTEEAESMVRGANQKGSQRLNESPELAFIKAIAQSNPDQLWALPGVREEFERRLDITGEIADTPIPVRSHIVRRSNESDDAMAGASTVLTDMFRDRMDFLAAQGVKPSFA
jgi:hypothetical protein